MMASCERKIKVVSDTRTMNDLKLVTYKNADVNDI